MLKIIDLFFLTFILPILASSCGPAETEVGNECLCQHPSIIFHDQCLSACPPSYYYDPDLYQCLPCDYGCQTCTGPSPTQCTTCLPGFSNTSSQGCHCFPSYLNSTPSTSFICENGFPFVNAGVIACHTCNTSCPDTFFYNATSQLCQPCRDGCIACSGSETGQCLKCNSSLFFDPRSRTC